MARCRRLSVLALALVVIGACVTPAFAQLGGPETMYPWPEDPSNLVKNPSFEAQGTDWKISLPAYSFPSSATAIDGTWSMSFKDTNLSTYTPLVTQPLALAPGWYNMRGWIKTIDVGTNSTYAGGRFALMWGSGAATSPVIRGTTDWTHLGRRSIAILPGDAVTMRLEPYGKPNGQIFIDGLEVHRQIAPAVEGFLLYPNYRGVLFSDGPQEIRVSVKLHPEELGLTLADVTVRLILETDNGLVLARRDVAPTLAAYIHTLDGGVAPTGRSRLRLQLLERTSGAVRFEYPASRIVKLTADARSTLTTYVDADNVLVQNGRRTFVIGIYDTSGYSNLPSYYEPRISKIAEAPINMYINYWLGGSPTSSLNALMTTLQKYGMTYLHTVNNWYTDNPDWPGGALCGGQTATALGADSFTQCMATDLGGNPGLAGYYTADERTADYAERVFHQYTILRMVDPDGVTFIAQMHPDELSRWRDATDVLGVDPYPIYNIPLGGTSPLEMVTDWVEAAKAAGEGSRPVWGVVQFFQFGSNGHWPTYDELRTMSYMAVVAGAKGLFYWSYGARALAWVTDPVVHEEYWQRLVRVTQEIKSLEPALLSPDAPYLVSVAPADTIRVLAKQVGDVRYIIAVNNTPKAGVAATFSLAGTANTVEVVGEGRSIAAGGSAFSDTFAPYQVHVYKIGGGVTTPPPTTTSGGTTTTTTTTSSGSGTTSGTSSGSSTGTTTTNTTTTTTTASTAQAPAIYMASPRDGMKVYAGSTVRLFANVVSVGPSRVQFSINGVATCTVASPGSGVATCPWTVPLARGASYRIQAKVWDAAGRTAESKVVTVTSP